MERALVVNCGSSSVKYRLLEPESGRVLARGTVERIGDNGSHLEHRDGEGSIRQLPGPFADHAAATDGMRRAFEEFGPGLDTAPPAVVGHRVVHGGEAFTAPVLVDDVVLTALEGLSDLAPLQNPACVAAIRTAREVFPGVGHVAVFDTAFHATLPPWASTYAVPREWRERYGVRRYGFHGTSYAYVCRAAARLLGRDLADTNLVALHLGNGASACAVEGGRSIDTSMGLTPLQGLVMGTRSGDVDPALPGHLARVAGLGAAEVDHALNHGSGLFGLCGDTDVREVTRRALAGDADAVLALDTYCYRIRCYVGAYLAALGRADAVVFTAGVGEHSAEVRARSLQGLQGLGIVVDDTRNHAPSGAARRISPDDAAVAVLVVPTDEEREIAAQALAVLRG
ncbi:MAG TPA: acetate kinase [Kineosporiaceae bacterium]|nr:acetate kinase [Kineosporiaceae bacterium]